VTQEQVTQEQPTNLAPRGVLNSTNAWHSSPIPNDLWYLYYISVHLSFYFAIVSLVVEARKLQKQMMHVAASPEISTIIRVCASHVGYSERHSISFQL
jgi:hypothetical protein